jgi:serine/threonine protein kinase
VSAQLVGSNFILGDVLGVGGMGVVYSAVQRSLGRTVAVKLPRPELASDPVVHEHFRVEARAGSRVNHPNVVRVLDFGTHDGRPFLVMDHVVGPRLDELLLDRGRMTVALATDLVRQLLVGLGEAHACGIVHADVKCSNILVETMRDGTAVPRLIDFGTACVDGDHARSTARQALAAGIPDYLAPELICGGPPSFASDVYAVGVILYELVTGVTPFAGGTSEQITQRALADLAMPMSWMCTEREISAELDAVVVHAMAKKPSARFADVAAFERALTSAMEHASAPAPTPTRNHGARTTVLCRGFSATTAALNDESAAPSEVENRDSALVDRHRNVLETAMLGNDGDAIAVAYLAVARALVEEHHLGAAVEELEQAVALLEASTDDARRAPIWRLLLTLAALYDGRGDRAMAQETTRDAHTHAIRVDSNVGRKRAEELWARLARTSCGAPRDRP